MIIKFDITAQADFILVTTEGEYDFAEARHIIRLAFIAAAEHGSQKIMIDCRKLTGGLTAVQRFDLGEWLAEFYFQRPKVTLTPIAVVGNVPFIDPGRFGETVAVNRLVPLKVSTDWDEALSWLQNWPASTLSKDSD